MKIPWFTQVPVPNFVSHMSQSHALASENQAGSAVSWATTKFKNGVTFRVGTVVDTQFVGDACFALVLLHDKMTGPIKCVVPNRFGMHWKSNDFIPASTISLRNQAGERPASMYPDKYPGKDDLTYNDKLSPSGPSTDPDPDARTGKIDQMKMSAEPSRWDGDVVIVGVCDGRDPFVVSWVRHRFSGSLHSPSSIERTKGVPIYFDYTRDKKKAAQGSIVFRDRLTRGRDPNDHPRWYDAETDTMVTTVPPGGGDSGLDEIVWKAEHGQGMPVAPSIGHYDRIPCPIPTINFQKSADGAFAGGKQVGHSCLPWLVEVSALEVAGRTFHSGSAPGLEEVPLYDDPRRFLPAMVRSSLEGVKTSQWGPYLSTWYDPFMHSVASPNVIGQYLHKELVDKAYQKDSKLEWATSLTKGKAAEAPSIYGSYKSTSDEGVRRLMFGGTGEIRLPKIVTESTASPSTIGQIKFYSNETLSKWEFRSDKAGVYSSEIDVIAGRQANAMSFLHPKDMSDRSGDGGAINAIFDDTKSFCPWVIGNGDVINETIGDTEDGAEDIRSGIRPGGFTWSYRLRLKQPNPSIEGDRGVGKLLVAGNNQFEIRAGIDPKYNRDGLQRWGTYDESRSIFAKKGISLIAPGTMKVSPADGKSDVTPASYKRGGLYVTGPTDDETVQAPVETADFIDSHKEWEDAQSIFVDAMVKYPPLRDVLETMMGLLKDLKDKHNSLVDKYNSHQHTYVVQGAAVQTTKGLAFKNASEVDKDNITKDDIKLIKSKTVFCGSE